MRQLGTRSAREEAHHSMEEACLKNPRRTILKRRREQVQETTQDRSPQLSCVPTANGQPHQDTGELPPAKRPKLAPGKPLPSILRTITSASPNSSQSRASRVSFDVHNTTIASTYSSREYNRKNDEFLSVKQKHARNMISDAQLKQIKKGLEEYRREMNVADQVGDETVPGKMARSMDHGRVTRSNVSLLDLDIDVIEFRKRRPAGLSTPKSPAPARRRRQKKVKSRSPSPERNVRGLFPDPSPITKKRQGILPAHGTLADVRTCILM